MPDMRFVHDCGPLGESGEPSVSGRGYSNWRNRFGISQGMQKKYARKSASFFMKESLTFFSTLSILILIVCSID